MATAEYTMKSRTGLILAITLITLILSACTAGQSRSSTESTAGNQAVVEGQLIPGYEGDGMDIPLDGTSLAAFDASMATVKRYASDETYKSLEEATKYLLVYDLAARGSKEILAERLNGLTGNEVLDRVGWRKDFSGKKLEGAEN